MYKGREKSLGDSSRAVDRTCKGRTKSVKIKVTAQELLTEHISGEQNLEKVKLLTECKRGEQNL